MTVVEGRSAAALEIPVLSVGHCVCGTGSNGT
jgi:hypothetical protein